MHRNKRNSGRDEDRTLVYCEGRTIYFFDEVNEDSVCDAIRFLDKLDKDSSKKEITIVINSGGGNCYDGLALYDRIRQSGCNVRTRGTGVVASMALILFLAGDEREVTENTRLLSHQVSVHDFCGRAEDFKIESREIDRLNDCLVAIISERTGQTENRIKRDQKPGDYWINAEKAKEEGYTDTIIKNTRTYRKKQRKTT
jgi:ATP-dependent Clp protease protease subunit